MQDSVKIKSVIGFTGSIHAGLILHPDNQHLIYPLGFNIIIKRIFSNQQTILAGHDYAISSIKISQNGHYIASGQKSFIGFVANILIWSFSKKIILHRLSLHKVEIISLCFSGDAQFLISQGGKFDENILIIWDVQNGKSLYRLPGKQNVKQICCYNKNHQKILSIYQNSISILKIDKYYKKISSLMVNIGNLKRNFTCAKIDQNDLYAYVGTKSGDFIQINLEKSMYKRLGPIKKIFSSGVSSINIFPNNDLLIGAGDGKIAKIAFRNFYLISECDLKGGITSTVFSNDHANFYCGTNLNNIYNINSDNFKSQLKYNSHSGKISDIAFPKNFSVVFATCSGNQIKIWKTSNSLQILNIKLKDQANFNKIAFMNDGKLIITACSDGNIRSYLPQSGKLNFIIKNAHLNDTTIINTTNTQQKFISGGTQGQIKIWKLNRVSPILQVVLKQHRKKITSLNISSDDYQMISTSEDGVCVLWNLKTYIKLRTILASYSFKFGIFHPDSYQILTIGSDRKIRYWQKSDGLAIKTIIGCQDGSINSIAITMDGQYFITGGDDAILKIWNYNHGNKIMQLRGHSSSITKIQISPNEDYIISISSDGSIVIWQFPQYLKVQKVNNQKIVKQKTESRIREDKRQVRYQSSNKRLKTLPSTVSSKKYY